jgi:hypothetical protein
MSIGDAAIAVLYGEISESLMAKYVSCRQSRLCQSLLGLKIDGLELGA